MKSNLQLKEMLAGDVIRSIGLTSRVADLVGSDQTLFDEVFEGIYSTDDILRNRSAEAAEKAARAHPRLLETHKNEIIRNLPNYIHADVRWRISLMLGLLDMKGNQLSKAISYLQLWLGEEKQVAIIANCIQSLAKYAEKNRWLRNEVIGIIEAQMERGSAGVKARGRNLLKALYRDK
jgi:hypothetical protein